MSRPITHEQRLLAEAEELVQDLSRHNSDTPDHTSRLEILEATAAEVGGFSLAAFRAAFGTVTRSRRMRQWCAGRNWQPSLVGFP